MKNNKGFTLVELLSTFILSSVIIVLLFQLIINLKDVYQQSGLKTDMLNKQYIITNKIYSDLNEKKAVMIDKCDESLICINFTFADGSVKKLQVNDINKTITYDNTTIKLTNEAFFDDMNINTIESQIDEQIFNISVPIYSTIIKDENFGINIVYPYNKNETTNNYGDKIIPPLTQYTYIPYIQSNGNQKIDLNYKAKITTEIRLDIELAENENTRTTNESTKSIIGSDDSAENRFNANFGSPLAQYNMLYYWLDKSRAAGGEIYSKSYENPTNRSVLTMKSGQVTFQGETLEVAEKTSDNTTNMILLGNTVSSFSKYDAKIYNFKIFENNNMIRNMVPAKRNTDNIVGLYDVINKVFYTSDGTDNFFYES